MPKMPHIQLDASIGASAAILPGDPARVDAVAPFLTDVREETFNREYKSITGTYKGVRILVISTGMGGPSTAICVEELADLGVTDMIRIGSCGALQSGLSLGQLVLCDRAVCDDGTSQTYTGSLRYASPELPAAVASPDSHTHTARDGEPTFSAASPDPHACTANGSETSKTTFSAASPDSHICTARDGKTDSCACLSPDSPSGEAIHHTDPGCSSDIHYALPSAELLGCCEEAARSLSFPYAVGSTRSHDGLYQRIKPQIDEFYSGKGVFASDMETAALFAVGAFRNVRTASILNVVVEWKKDIKEGIGSYKDGAAAAAAGEENEILTALEALYLMQTKRR